MGAKALTQAICPGDFRMAWSFMVTDIYSLPIKNVYIFGRNHHIIE
jgi:hypothetical protein